MPAPIVKGNPRPQLADWGDLLQTEVMQNLNCHAVGTIQDFDATTQKATVSINYKWIKNGNTYDYQPLVDCPVIIAGGGGGYLTFPIAVGDTCMVFFNDVDMDRWFTSNQIAEPKTGRMHAFTDAVVLVGLRSFKTPVPDYATDAAQFRFGDTLVSLDSKIQLMNAATDIKTLLNGLIDLIALITVTCATPGNPSSPPINAAAITAYKMMVGNLFK